LWGPHQGYQGSPASSSGGASAARHGTSACRSEPPFWLPTHGGRVNRFGESISLARSSGALGWLNAVSSEPDRAGSDLRKNRRERREVALHPRRAKQGRLRPRPALLALGYSPLALASRRSTGPFRPERNGAQALPGASPKDGTSNRSVCCNVIHQGSEHRRNATSRAQQIFSQRLRGCESIVI